MRAGKLGAGDDSVRSIWPRRGSVCGTHARTRRQRFRAGSGYKMRDECLRKRLVGPFNQRELLAQLRPCLVSKNFKILRHIEFLDTYMKY